MIKVRNLTKRFGRKTVIEDVSLKIHPRKITSFIGPNGAGKSTLLSMVSRLIDADTGEVFLDQKKSAKMNTNEFAKKVSISKQSNFMNVRLTIEELVSFGRFPYSRGHLTEEDHKHVEQALEYMNLTDIKDSFLDELSGGQRQRAFIAMVIAQDTEYILLDEPLSNLDMRHSVQIMKTLRRLVDELGKTIVIVIHDINFASCYSDEIVALKDGKIVKHGRTCDVIDRCVLKDIYDMDIDIKEIENQRICVYF